MEKTRKYRPDYNEAFRDEQVKWFEEHMDKLPMSLQINSSSTTSNLPYTVKMILEILKSNKPSVVFSGYMETLMQIKDRLQEQGIV